MGEKSVISQKYNYYTFMGLMRTQIFSQEFALYNLTSLLSDVTFFENNLFSSVIG